MMLEAADKPVRVTKNGDGSYTTWIFQSECFKGSRDECESWLESRKWLAELLFDTVNGLTTRDYTPEKIKASEALSRLTPDQCVELDVIYFRYQCFAGLCTENEDLAAQDRAQYMHLHRDRYGGIEHDKHVVAFMHAVSGMPLEWCDAWYAFENDWS